MYFYLPAPLALYVKSQGCEDPGIPAGTCGRAIIKVNGVDHCKHGRGHNVVVVNYETGQGGRDSQGKSGGGAVRRRDSQEEGLSGGKDSQRIRALVRNLECFLLNIMIFLLIITIKNSSFIQLCCEQVVFIVQVSFHCPSRSQSRCVRRGGALGARAPPPPHLGKKFRSEMSKRREKFPPRYIGKK